MIENITSNGAGMEHLQEIVETVFAYIRLVSEEGGVTEDRCVHCTCAHEVRIFMLDLLPDRWYNNITQHVFDFEQPSYAPPCAGSSSTGIWRSCASTSRVNTRLSLLQNS